MTTLNLGLYPTPKVVGTPAPITNYLLLETGDVLLLETGDRLLLES